MDTLVKANIFFFVSTISTIVFLLLGSVAFYYLIKILKNVRDATDSLKEGIESASEEMHEITSHIKESVVFNLLFAKKRRKK
jgi:hypothetical protein